VEHHIRRELINKFEAGCAAGILNAPDPGFNPVDDVHLPIPYGPPDHTGAKKKNKIEFQKMLGLEEDTAAPLFFWPSRLDPVQKGCQLLSDIFYGVLSKYWQQNLQVVFVANGDYQGVFRDIVNFHGLHRRVAVCDFSEQLEHLAYGASDFLLMPSLFEPCGLPQMIGQIYGCLPVAHDTGGIHDTVQMLDVSRDQGSGFLFEIYDASGLAWAIDRAMDFYALPEKVKARQIARIMRSALETFNHEVNARQYIDLYEKMLDRPLIA
jgi:starch synthase/alpha-amylase